MIYCIKLIDNYFGRYVMHLAQQSKIYSLQEIEQISALEQHINID